MKELRTIAQVIDGVTKNVGGSFEVTSPMPGSRIRQLSPFLLIDHLGPMHIAATEDILGGDAHPHIGFETVTLVYQGELDHRDTGGNNGTIGALDVQWMTAGSGLLHEEKFGREFTRRGGTLELIQLWVNVPKKDKLVKPGYQELEKEQIPVVTEQNGNVSLRIISGSYGNVKGPANTFSPIELWDLQLSKGTIKELILPADYNLGIYIVTGKVTVNGKQAGTKQLLNFGWDSEKVSITALEDSLLVILSGEPIEEPLATYGPLVMNTNKELVQAMADFEAGKFGSLSPSAD